MAIEHALSTHDLRGPAVDYKRDRTHAAKWALGEADYAPGRRSEPTTRHPVHPQQKINAAFRRMNGLELKRATHRTDQARRHAMHSEEIHLDDPQPSSGLPTLPSSSSDSDPTPDMIADDSDTPSGAADGSGRRSHSHSPSPAPGPAPDAEITYSFDAPRGPDKGSEILGMALARAVEKFEGNETEKLVRQEYEVVVSDGEGDGDEEQVVGRARRGKGRGRRRGGARGCVGVTPETGKKKGGDVEGADVDEDGFELI